MKKLLVLPAIMLALAGLLVFTACSQEPEPDITLSGTITVKHNGETVPYVEIWIHDNVWSWNEATLRFDSSESNVPWSITTRPLSKETEIFFRVEGFEDDAVDSPRLFSLDVKDLSKKVYKSSISDITIDMADLKTITLSGTPSSGFA